MANIMVEAQVSIVDNLSQLIRVKMDQLSDVQKYPGSDPDDMDNKLELFGKQVKGLIKMRQDFEVLMTDVNLNF